MSLAPVSRKRKAAPISQAMRKAAASGVSPAAMPASMSPERIGIVSQLAEGQMKAHRARRSFRSFVRGPRPGGPGS